MKSGEPLLHATAKSRRCQISHALQHTKITRKTHIKTTSQVSILGLTCLLAKLRPCAAIEMNQTKGVCDIINIARSTQLR
jgi:hypothetical protein